MDGFLFIPDVKVSVANQVLHHLNNKPWQKRDLYELQDLYAKGQVMHVYHAWLERMSATSAREGNASDNLTLGYVTHDVSSFCFSLMQLTGGF